MTKKPHTPPTKRKNTAAGRLSAKVRLFYRTHPRFFLILEVASIYLLFFVSLIRFIDPDFGWHLMAGNYIRQHGIPSHDVFSYTAGNFSWVNHEWANDVLFSHIYQLGGLGLLVWIYSALWTAALYINGRRNFGITFLAALALMPYASVRPAVWTLLGLAVLLRITAIRSRFPRYLIPVLFALWANLHGGFVIGFIYLAYLAISRHSREWAYILLLSILCSFANAYGPDLYVEIVRTVANQQIHGSLSEWQPLNIMLASWAYIIVWTCGFILFSKDRLQHWLRFETILLVMGLLSSRNVMLFVIVSMRHTETYLKQMVAMVPRRLDVSRQLTLGIIIGIAVVGLFYGVKQVYLPFTTLEANYPAKEVQYLRQHGCAGNLFNDYNFGGYLIWKLPQQQVYIDGRMPTWVAPDGSSYFETYLDVINNRQTRDAEFHKYNIRCALLQRSAQNKPIIRDLMDSDWQIVSRSRSGILLVSPGTTH